MPPLIALIAPATSIGSKTIHLPTNLAILGAALHAEGYKSVIVDLNIVAARDEGKYLGDAVKRSVDMIAEVAGSSDFFGFTTLDICYPITIQIAAAIKKRFSKPIIFGGQQATLTAKPTLTAFEFIDYVVKYEGETTLPELISVIQNAGDLRKVKGIVYRCGSEIIENEKREFLRNLDDSPIPAFGSFDIDAYYNLSKRVSIPLDVGRGCPYKCTFCCTSLVWQNKCRYKSVRRVVEEMDNAFGETYLDFFTFTHDTLTANKQYVLDLCAQLGERDYRWDCFSRCDTIDDEIAVAMRSAGCKEIFFGVESASERIQRIIKKNLDASTISKAINLCLKNDITGLTSYIIGFPEEDHSDLEATMSACIRDAARYGQFRVVIAEPQPGTELLDVNRDRLISPKNQRIGEWPFIYTGNPGKHSFEMVLRNQEIFSSFYLIKPFNYSIDFLLDFNRLFQFIGSNFACTVHLLFSTSCLTPIQLLERYHAIHSSDTLEYSSAPLKKIVSMCEHKLGEAFIPTEEVMVYENIAMTVKNLEHDNDVDAIDMALDALQRDDPKEISKYNVGVSPHRIHTFKVNITHLLARLAEGVDYSKEFCISGDCRMMIYINAFTREIVHFEVSDSIERLIALASKNPSLATYLDALRNVPGDYAKNRALLVDLSNEGIFSFSRNSDVRSSIPGSSSSPS